MLSQKPCCKQPLGSLLQEITANKKGVKIMSKDNQLEHVVDVITELLAFLTVVLIVLVYVNRFVAGKMGTAGFLPVKAANILETVREISILLVVALAGLQFSLKHGWVVFIIYAVLVAAAVIFMFFPNVLPVGTKSVLTAIGL